MSILVFIVYDFNLKYRFLIFVNEIMCFILILSLNDLYRYFKSALQYKLISIA